MNLVGNARGGAQAAAEHFLNTRDNEHVEVYELRGFVSDDLAGALNEIYAISRGTRCKQFLYSLSLNPPPTEQATTQDFEDAIARVEAKLGLSDQPRAIVFHEKKGRRHAHCVWSRIDVGEMKAIQMSFDREKLKTISRELFLHHGWQMPPGLAHRESRDPRNYSLAEWQQARRIKTHPNQITRDIEDAWAISDTRESFAHAL
ncbi:MAG: relaxase/mobilization nuclease domain-containing protein, partial [Pseudomonadota bacterium]